MTETDCPFCEIIYRDDPDVREVYRDENVVAFFPTEPAVLGHTMVVPRRHVPDIWSLRSNEAADLAAAVLRLADAVRASVRPEGLNVIQSNGTVATQTVPHLHVHIVPRNAGDAMGPIWPEDTEYTTEEKDGTLRAVKAAVSALPLVETEISPEDRRKHLDYIQAVITRQSAASASTKGWLLPVVTAVFGFALTQHVWLLALLGICLIAVFAYVDANYLRSEKAYRELYKTVSRSERTVPHFTLDPTDAREPLPADAPAAAKWKTWCVTYVPEREVWKSWSIAPFYCAMLLLGVGVAVTAALTGDKVESKLPAPGPTNTVVVTITPSLEPGAPSSRDDSPTTRTHAR
ncbi:HIT domain-containing protein [Gordonia sp. (in: high G+C Gram-positive bacteria)]|uniref:HIT family protein n=1 Tax=Gordonia sp. (in: high G+C Gram-positive bacteria) TaxID=84139 RepID=UPI001989221F|nr:HIT domain-containing protein [Gordonia sp. (in: high G+C Gram-positive bacteria)]MBD0020855.1 HIT domain-containing protein [Gordonia sp. (in: high G+C Gram-positive bacteria)]